MARPRRPPPWSSRSCGSGPTPGIGIEAVTISKAGMSYRVTVHVQTDGAMTLHEAHALGGRVKSAIWASTVQVNYVLVHMEPYVRAESPTDVV